MGFSTQVYWSGLVLGRVCALSWGPIGIKHHNTLNAKCFWPSNSPSKTIFWKCDQGLPCGSVGESPPANADTDSLIPVRRRSHKRQRRWACEPQRLCLCSRACEPQTRAAATALCASRVLAPQQGKTPQWEARAPQLESNPRASQPESSPRSSQPESSPRSSQLESSPVHHN